MRSVPEILAKSDAEMLKLEGSDFHRVVVLKTLLFVRFLVSKFLEFVISLHFRAVEEVKKAA